MADLGTGQDVLAVVFSVGLASFTLGVLGGGRAADVVPARRLGLVAAAGVVAGLLGSAAAGSVAVLVVAFGAVFGGSSGLGYATAVRVAGTVATRRGGALAIVVSAYAAGTVVIAPVSGALLDRVGVRWTFAALALGLGLVALTGALLLAGVRPRPIDEAGTVSRHVPRGLRARMWLVFLLGSAPALAAFAHAADITADPAAAAFAVPLLSVGNLVGRLVAGPVSDRIGRRWSLHGNAVLLVAVCAVLALGPGPVTALAALVALGLQYGALSVLVPAAVADRTGSAVFGTTYGVVFTGWGVAGLLAPVVAALGADRAGWDSTFAGCTLLAVLGWLAVARAVPRRAEAG